MYVQKHNVMTQICVYFERFLKKLVGDFCGYGADQRVKAE
jgi:hypothetical protein